MTELTDSETENAKHQSGKKYALQISAKILQKEEGQQKGRKNQKQHNSEKLRETYRKTSKNLLKILIKQWKSWEKLKIVLIRNTRIPKNLFR